MSEFLARLRELEVPGWLRVVYCLIFLAAFAHAVVTEGALTCCPPGYADIATFVDCGQAAGVWTAAAIALVEVITYMVFLVPKAYNSIKEKGERAERERTLAALREAGVDEETRRRVEDALERSARRNGR